MSAARSEPVIIVRGLERRFGELVAVRDVSFDVERASTEPPGRKANGNEESNDPDEGTGSRPGAGDPAGPDWRIAECEHRRGIKSSPPPFEFPLRKFSD